MFRVTTIAIRQHIRYIKYVIDSTTAIAELQDEFELEYAMSQIFSKKQKEIFLNTTLAL
jgi:hypothetical protein